MPGGSLSERQLRERGLAALAELARLDEIKSSLNAIAARALDLTTRLLDADRAALCAIHGDETVEWLAQRRLDALIAASADLRPSELPWLRRALETGRPEILDRRLPDHGRTALSDAADRLGVASFVIVPLSSGGKPSGVLGLTWRDDPPELAHDEELLTTIGRLIGLALGNVRLRDALLARQRELDESEARYRSLFDQAPEPHIVCDWDMRIVGANAAAIRLFGVTRRRLLARALDEVTELDRDERRRLMTQLRRARAAQAGVHGRRADGTTFPLLLHIAVTRQAGEERLYVQLRDLTEQERLQSELLQAQKMEALGQLISGVAHDLDDPLEAIIAIGGRLSADERLPAPLGEEVENLLAEAARTRRVVENLLDFARQSPPQRRPTELAPLIERTLELHAYSVRAAHIDVRLLLPADLPAVEVDAGQIQQVLLNLTLNAIQAIGTARPSGAITITAGTVGGRRERIVRLRIEDDGPGIDRPVRARVFEPFFTTKDSTAATGLGLSVSYGIVAAHGGRMWFEPAHSGGAAFVVELPASRVDSDRTHGPSSARGGLRRPSGGGSAVEQSAAHQSRRGGPP